MWVIEESHSVWCCPIVLTVLIGRERWVCTVLCQLPQGQKVVTVWYASNCDNFLSQFDAYLVPRVNKLLDWLGMAQFFRALVFTKGYWKIPSKEKTFFTPYGLYQFIKLPFGLFRALTTFQCLVDHVLRPHTVYAAAYLNDAIIHCNTWAVLESPREAGLMANLKNCAFVLGVPLGRRTGGLSDG